METKINILEIKRMEVQETLRERTINLMDPEPTDDNIDYKGVCDWIRDAAEYSNSIEEEICTMMDVATSHGKDVGLDTIDYIYECRECILDRIWEVIDNHVHSCKLWIQNHNYIKIKNIQWDSEYWCEELQCLIDEDGAKRYLDTSMTVEVPLFINGEKLEGEDLYEYISEKITDDTSWCHEGFEIVKSTEKGGV